jgi:hypothetical protein
MPTVGATCSDQRQPGSQVARPRIAYGRGTTSVTSAAAPGRAPPARHDRQTAGVGARPGAAAPVAHGAAPRSRAPSPAPNDQRESNSSNRRRTTQYVKRQPLKQQTPIAHPATLTTPARTTRVLPISISARPRITTTDGASILFELRGRTIFEGVETGRQNEVGWLEADHEPGRGSGLRKWAICFGVLHGACRVAGPGVRLSGGMKPPRSRHPPSPCRRRRRSRQPPGATAASPRSAHRHARLDQGRPSSGGQVRVPVFDFASAPVGCQDSVRAPRKPDLRARRQFWPPTGRRRSRVGRRSVASLVWVA